MLPICKVCACPGPDRLIKHSLTTATFTGEGNCEYKGGRGPDPQPSKLIRFSKCGTELNRSDFEFKCRAPKCRRWSQTVGPHVGRHRICTAARQPKFPNCKLWGVNSAKHPGLAAVPQGRSRKPASTSNWKGPQRVPPPVAAFALSGAAERRSPRLIKASRFGIRGPPAAEHIPKAKQKVVTIRGPCAASFAALCSQSLCRCAVASASHLPAHEKQGQCSQLPSGRAPPAHSATRFAFSKTRSPIAPHPRTPN
jgi:hypothetical protein